MITTRSSVGRPLTLVLTLVALTACRASRSSSETAPAGPMPSVVADPEDVGTIDAIVDKLFELLGGAAGQARDWKRIRSLYHPYALTMPISPDTADGGARIGFQDFDQYASSSAAYFEKNAFYERPIHQRVERFGHMAQVWVTHEVSQTAGGEPVKRGINSIQLHWDEERWWILTVLWEAEEAGQPIPAEYLTDGQGR